MIRLLMNCLPAFFFVFLSCKDNSRPEPENKTTVTSQHTPVFNAAIDKMLENYFDLSESFVNWDSAGIVMHSRALKMTLDSFALDGLLKDTVASAAAQEPLSNARVEISSIIADPSLAEKRASFNLLSDNMKNLLSAVKYDRRKLYWQECPMAFDDTKPGYWLSPVDSIRNPYLGTKHPKYGSGMLECGGTKEVLDFTTGDTMRK